MPRNRRQCYPDLPPSSYELPTDEIITQKLDSVEGGRSIASENLRSDITSIRRAISNTNRANQVIATADSALGQVSSLLNDIRGLVTESANTGALSDEQIAANQLQLDSSLEALNRIAQTTTFQGRRLLDGSLDFLTTAGTNSTNLTNVQIDQANLGAAGSVSVDIEVSTSATQATVDVAGIDTAATPATGDLSLAIAAIGASRNVNFAATLLSSSGDLSINGAVVAIDATAAGAYDGAAGNGNYIVNIVDSTAASTFDAGTNTFTINLDITAAPKDVDDVTAEITGIAGFDAATTSGGINNVFDGDGDTFTLAGGRDAGNEQIRVTTAATGALVDVDVTFVEGAVPGAAVVGGDIMVTIDNTAGSQTTFADIAALIDATAEFSATTTSTSSYDTTADAPPAVVTLNNGLDRSDHRHDG